MKKIKFAVIVLLSAVTLLADSCAMDYAAVVLRIYVTDKQGNDLLNPEVNGFIGNNIELEFRGEKYTTTNIPTKTTSYTFHGLSVNQDNEDKYYLYFGQLSGEEKFDDEFRITWGDGSKDIITLKRTPSLMITLEKWKLNGKRFDGMPLTIVH